MKNDDLNEESASGFRNKAELYNDQAEYKIPQSSNIRLSGPEFQERLSERFSKQHKQDRQQPQTAQNIEPDSSQKSDSFKRISKKPQQIDFPFGASSNRLSKNPFIKSGQSFEFPGQQKDDKQKSSIDFIFNNNDSISLFSSQKSQPQIQPPFKSKNLQNLTKLLKEHYNENYLKNSLESKKSYLMSHSIRRSEVPYFITREPILFQKRFYGLRSGHDLSGNYLCKLVENKIYYKNVQSEELQNLDTVKCECLQIDSKQSISPSLQIDSSSQHLFYYSNTTNQIVVLSLSKSRRPNPEICRIKTRTQRKNPLLYLIQINKQVILLLIGGYNNYNKSKKDQVQGCKYVEIFPVDKWGTDIIESKLIKLINGKIYPLIVFPVKIQQNDAIVLIGGNTVGKLNGNHVSFKDHKVVNKSSNLRGVYIHTKHIIECIQQNKDIMSLPHGNNISVQIQDKVDLYNGYVDYLKTNQKQKIRLFLPKMKEFYTMKIIKKEVRILKSKQNQQRILTFDANDSYHHLEMKCFKKPITKYYEITNKGFFQEKTIKLGSTNPFSMQSEFKCPCEFM